VLVVVLLALFFMIWRRKKRVKPVVPAVPDPAPPALPPETLSVEDVLPSRTVALDVPESETLPPPVAAPVPEPMMEMPEAVADAPMMENPVAENLAVENPVVANAMEESAAKSDGAVPDQQTLPPLKLDLSNISLDLDSGPGAPSPTKPADAGETDLSVKLETALAYMDTGGDTESIRQWLEEVIRDGSADLVDRAKAALDRLNSGAG
jgi:FimV-like protein